MTRQSFGSKVEQSTQTLRTMRWHGRRHPAGERANNGGTSPAGENHPLVENLPVDENVQAGETSPAGENHPAGVSLPVDENVQAGETSPAGENHPAGVSLLVCLGLMMVSIPGWTQDPAFSQFYANPIYMNPAMAGVEGPVKVYLGYRNQWPGATDPYSTYHASYEQFIEALQGGVGVHVINDRQGGGIFNTLSLDAIYAYHLQVTADLMITGGFQASVGQRNLNPDGLVLPNELAGVSTTTLSGYSRVYPDFAVGFGGFFRNFYGGVAAHHLLQPYTAPSEDPNTMLSRKYTAHLGAMIPIYEKRFGKELLQLSPNLVFIQQDIYQQLNYGLEVLYSNFIGGVWFRQDLLFSYGTLIFSAGYGNDQFRVRYSYDAKLSAPDVHIPNLGAHEVSLVIIFENLYKSAKRRAIKSPKI